MVKKAAILLIIFSAVLGMEDYIRFREMHGTLWLKMGFVA
jgi:hypothetical protein